jgi:hypothetical protein
MKKNVGAQQKVWHQSVCQCRNQSQLSNPSEVNIPSTGQEIPRLLWNTSDLFIGGRKFEATCNIL